MAVFSCVLALLFIIKLLFRKNIRLFACVTLHIFLTEDNQCHVIILFHLQIFQDNQSSCSERSL